MISTNAFTIETSIASSESENEITAEKRDWYINEEGIAETQDYFFLPESDSMPSYIEEVEYWDNSVVSDELYPSEMDSLGNVESSQDDISLAAITKMNESEPNNTYLQANTYQLGAELSGAISSTNDIDYYKVDFRRDGKAKFHLTNIPQNCNYDVKIYTQPKSGGSLTLLKTLSSTQNYELLDNYVIDPSKYYYVQVYSVKNYSTSQKYVLKVSLTPSDDMYEPNNSFKEAYPISSSAYINASIHKPTDVDFYTVKLNAGVLTAALSGIPRGCDYRMAIYDRNQNLVAETPQSGNNDKVLSIAVKSDIYYIKIHSKSGFNSTSSYRLALNSRSATTTVKGSVSPQIKTSGDKALSSTPISGLPIKIVYTKKNNSTQYVLASTTTNSSGAFSVTFSLPSDVNQLFVKVYPASSSVSIQLLDETVYSTLFQIPYTAATITLNITNQSNITQQFKASMSLWRFANLALSAYKGKGTGRTPKLEVRCTYGTSKGTNATATRILISGISQDQDYYDWDIFLHEFGHWIMMNNGGMPDDYGGSHQWSKPSKLGTAYSEGWAHYFSSAMRNNRYVLDYNSSGSYFGGDLGEGKIKPSFSASFSLPSPLTPYTENEKMEINVGASLWNLSSNNSKSYTAMENIMRRKHNDWQSFYNAYIANLNKNDLGTAWDTCEKFHVAYDLEVPVVSLSINGLVASMSATDNITVKDYEWYVDGVKKGSGTGASGTLNLGDLNLSAGTHTLQCRVYDPEGRASGSRPRLLRYGSATQSFNISSKSANVTPATISNSIDISCELNEIAEDITSLHLGDKYQVSALVPDEMDLYLYAEATGAVKTYSIISPDKTIYEEIDYIAPDSPYIIENAMPGEWEIIVENYSPEEIQKMSLDQPIDENQSMDSILFDDVAIPPVTVALNLSVRPSKVEILNDLEITNNPYILDKLIDEQHIAIYESGTLVDKQRPLLEGLHELELCRVIDGKESIPTKLTVIIDTKAPIVSYSGVPETTTRDRCVIYADFSEDIAYMTVNGIPVDLGQCDRSFYADCFMLDIGINSFEIVATDYAGNSSNRLLQVQRIKTADN